MVSSFCQLSRSASRLSTAPRVGLVFDRRFEAPFLSLPAQLDLVVAILNHDPVELFAIEIDDIARLALRFLRVRVVCFRKT